MGGHSRPALPISTNRDATREVARLGRKAPPPVSSKVLCAEAILFTHLVLNIALLKSKSPPRFPEQVKKLPFDEQAKCWLGHVRDLDEYLNDHEERLALIRRIASYLGLPWNVSRSTLQATKQVRAMIQDGCCDEQIALFLDRYLGNQKSGRPQGASIPDRTALRALELRDRDGSVWTWPKLADELLNCKAHPEHNNDSECASKLKQAVTRLRVFLKELSVISDSPNRPK